VRPWTINPPYPQELASSEEAQNRLEYDKAIRDRLGAPMSQDDYNDDPDFADFDRLRYESCEDEHVPYQTMLDVNGGGVDTYDQYVGASVWVTLGDEILAGRVVGCKRELDGTLLGLPNTRPMLDTRTYEIEFPEGLTDEYTANVIAQNMYAQYDEEVNQLNLMEGIVDHRNDGHTVTHDDVNIKHWSNIQVRKTMISWHLCVEWKDGTTSWERLAYIKQSNPMDVVDYAASKELKDEPDFV
jgi:hypothetical protein